MALFSKIIVATDGSNSSMRVAKVAGHLAQKEVDCTVYVLFVIDGLPIELSAMLEEADIQYASNMTHTANEIINRTIKAMCLNERVTKVEKVQRSGYPANEIVQLAKEVDANVIVMGNSNISMVEEFLSRAGTSHKVLHNAPCNVIVVK